MIFIWKQSGTSHDKSACDGIGGTVKRSATKASLKRQAHNQGWGQVQYLYLSTYLSVLDVLECLVYGNAKVLQYLVYGNAKVLVLDQKVLGTYK